MKKIIALIFTVSLLVQACKTDDPILVKDTTNPLDTITQYSGILLTKDGNITFDFNYSFGSQNLEFNTKNYITAANDTVNVENLRYYLSNITLKNAAGAETNLKNYFLVDPKANKNNSINLLDIKAGNYTEISFLLGVDSVTNFSGVGNGDLDPGYGMYWTWNTGYIFFRLNGRTPSNKTYSFDLGGNQNLVKITLPLHAFKVKSVNTKITLNLDVNQVFENPENYSLLTDDAQIHTATTPSAAKLAKNLKTCFSVTDIVSLVN